MSDALFISLSLSLQIRANIFTGIKFYLIDSDSIPHLAIIGDEREQRDGHYTYRVSEEFAKAELGIPPLKQGNLVGVRKWLKDRITQSTQQHKKRMMMMNSGGMVETGKKERMEVRLNACPKIQRLSR